MEFVLKVWYKSNNNKFKCHMNYTLSLDKEEKELIIKNISINDLDEIKILIKKNLNIPANKLKCINCMNGCIDLLEKKITILSDIYVTDCYFRKLKIEKLLNAE
jgi:hypothetical protein